MRTTQKDGHKSAGHDTAFKPTKDLQRKVKADFEHMSEDNNFKKSHRGPNGDVITAPRNFLTNPPKIGKVGKG